MHNPLVKQTLIVLVEYSIVNPFAYLHEMLMKINNTDHALYTSRELLAINGYTVKVNT